MQVQILQHVPFEDIGSIAKWLKSRKATVTYTRFFANESLPHLDNLDLIVIMGGPMSVKDESILPWLRAEKDFIHNAIQRNIPMIGICLGAQLIASALGTRVYRNAQKEIGWFPVVSVPSTEDSFHFPETFHAFHWHGETFDLPENSIHLARSEGCAHQAFQIGKSIIGLQFHLETTPESARNLIENCRDEIEEGLYIQAEQKIMGFPLSGFQRINGIMDELLSSITPNAKR